MKATTYALNKDVMWIGADKGRIKGVFAHFKISLPKQKPICIQTDGVWLRLL